MEPQNYLITASTGIGAETARQLARLGHRLFIVSRRTEHCEALAAELRQIGSETAFLAGDLIDPEFAPKAVSKCVEFFHRLDGLFNVAGISARKSGDAPLHECTEEGWQISLETNVTTQYRMCRESLRVMLGQELHADTGQRGAILNMSSILGIHPEPTHFSAIAYATGKGAIIAMTHSAAAFYAKDRIRINALAPGLVHTPMSTRASEDPKVLNLIARKQSLTGGVIPVRDAAAAAVFLLTESSRSITGEVLEVDAGWNLS